MLLNHVDELLFMGFRKTAIYLGKIYTSSKIVFHVNQEASNN